MSSDKFIESDFSQIEPRIGAHLTSRGIEAQASVFNNSINGMVQAVDNWLNQNVIDSLLNKGAHMSEVITMRPSAAKQAIMHYFALGLAVCLWGSPGIGKSGMVASIAQEMHKFLIDIRAATLDPTDVRGVPAISGRKCFWTVPEFLPNIEVHGEEGIFFVDEMNRAMPLTMNSFFQLIQDKKMGDYIFPPKWNVIAACNREGDGGGIQKMPDALCNRFVHINMVPHLDDFISWAVQHDINPKLLAFLKMKPQLLDDYEGAKKANKLSRAFPTPRAWEKVARVTDLNLDKSLNNPMIAGIVGEGPACEYVSFLEIVDKMPDLDEIIKYPKKGKIPDALGALYAVVSGLAYKTTTQNFENILTYLNRIDSPEFCVMAVKEACQRDKTLKQTPTFMNWVENYQDVLF